MHNKPHTESAKKKISEAKKAQGIVPKTAFKKGYVPWNKGKKCPWTSERNRKMNLNRKPEEHWNWKGGISKVDKKIRRMPEYLKWREDVFIRDNFTCQDCGKNKCYVTAHHIISMTSIVKANQIKSNAEARKCPDLWDITNGKTLCEECHKKTDNYAGRTKKLVVTN